MAGRMTETPPTERKNVSGIDREGHFTIIEIDREQHTVSLDVGGYPVTLICSPQNNPKAYQQIKSILLDMIVGDIPHN